MAAPLLARAALLGALALAGCAPSLVPRGAGARTLSGEGEVAAAAELLRLEDRRELDLGVLQRVAASPNPELRRRAGLAVGRIRGEGGLPLLLRLLADPDTSVTATAAFSLGQLGDTTAVPALAAQMGRERASAVPTVTAEAAAALGKLRTERARRALDEFLWAVPTDSADVREPVGAALLAAWRFPRGGDLAPIIRWTTAADPELRWRAAYALARRPDPAATPTLAGLVRDPDWRVRSFALRGLTATLADSSGLGADRARGVLLDALADTDGRVRITAARTLGSHGAPESVGALTRLLASEDSHLAVTAAESLGRLGTRAAGAAAPLRDLSLDGRRIIPVRTAALAALAEVSPGEVPSVAARLAADPAWRARAAAARAFARVVPIPRPERDALLRDRDARVAAAALDAVVNAPGADLVALRPFLLESIRAPDVGVRTAALSGLAKLADPASLAPVLDALTLATADPEGNDAALGALEVLDALRKAGVDVAGPFFSRFSRSSDPLVRQRVEAMFGDTARRAWGPALPLETGRDLAEYRQIVRRLVVPALAGRLPRARIRTGSGDVDLRLFAADAPLTVHNFLALAERGYFDGQEWPRVVANFVIQGGDPRGDTSGGPGYAIRDEINRHRYGVGTLGMALSGPDTGGSQFFITHSPQPHLDGGYTVFGEVEQGMEVVDRVQVGERIVRVTRLR